MDTATERASAARASPIGAVGNFLLYQFAWLACVMGAAAGRPELGIAAALSVTGLHLALSRSAMGELKLLFLTALIGGGWENLIVTLDWVHYRGGHAAGAAPVWILALWVAFATTFNVSLRWLQGRNALAALAGLVGGPLAWYGGARLGALELPDLPTNLIGIGLGWAVLLPLLLALANRLGRTASPARKAEE